MTKKMNFVNIDRPEKTEGKDWRVNAIYFAYHRDDEIPAFEISLKVGDKSVKFVLDICAGELSVRGVLRQGEKSLRCICLPSDRSTAATTNSSNTTSTAALKNVTSDGTKYCNRRGIYDSSSAYFQRARMYD
nr:hypothetical protein HmN_000453300 [Hymenolepis microstoma]